MPTTIAIDPGKKANYVAQFEAGRLAVVWSVNDATLEGAPSSILADNVYLEHMRHRPGDARSVVNDLIDVATNGALYAGRFGCPVILVTPQRWKGQVPKEIMTERILRALSDAERQNLERHFKMFRVIKSLQHNYIDAVGIGLWASGRI